MRQILQSYRSGELWLAEVPTAACKSGGVLVRTRHSLVSAGTEKMAISLAQRSLLGKARARPDLVKQVLRRVRSEGLLATMEKVFAKLDEPISLGYSAAGVVVEAGRDATGFQPGDRVAIAGAGYATHAEFNYVPRNLCVKIPDGVDDADACFATLGAIALQGVRQASPAIGERVVVIGLGLLGLLTVQLLKANGCAVLGVDPDPDRAELALRLGADAAVATDAEAACHAFTGGRGADAVVITAATPSNGPIEAAAEMSRQKGRVVVVGLVGMDVPRDPFYLKELDLRLSMSYGPGRYDPAYEEQGQDYPFGHVRFTEQRNMESFLYLVQQGKVTPSALVTHRFQLDDALDAYELLGGKPADKGAADGEPAPKYLGIVLDYPPDAPLERTVPSAAAAPATARGVGGSTLGIGFVGAGGFARGTLLPRLQKHGKAVLTGVCTTTGKTSEQTARRHGFAFATTDRERLLEDRSTHAVFVVTAHDTHARFACEALRRGKHVFVEKPLCIVEEDLDAYADALETARADGHAPCLMVGFNRRFSPHARALREAFEGRATPMAVQYRVNAGRVPPEHWIQDPRVGGGRILGEGCHFVDLCSFLIGSAPVEVTATSIASRNRAVVAQDSVAITIRYEDGSLATIHYVAEGSPRMPKERCEVFADGKSAVLDDYRATDLFGAGKNLKGRQAKGFDEELDAFVEAALAGGAWPIPWEELVATQRVCFAALRSLETGRSVALDAVRTEAADVPPTTLDGIDAPLVAQAPTEALVG